MSPRANSRRAELLEEAIHLFAERGFDGTSVATLVDRLGMSKAAFGYHVESKDALLVELAEPLLTSLETLEADAAPSSEFIERYLDALLSHADLVTWIDGDRSVLSHPVVGGRLDHHLVKMRSMLGDGRADSELRGSMALAAMWRPIRNLDATDVESYRGSVVDAVLAILNR